MTSATHGSINQPNNRSPPRVSPKEANKLRGENNSPLLEPAQQPSSASSRQKRKLALSDPDDTPLRKKRTRHHSPPPTGTVKSSSKVTDQRKPQQQQHESHSHCTSSSSRSHQESVPTSNKHNFPKHSQSDDDSRSPSTPSDDPSKRAPTTSPVSNAKKKKKNKSMGNCIQSRSARRDGKSPAEETQQVGESSRADPPSASSPNHRETEGGGSSPGEEGKEHHLEQRSRRRLSLIHADPITHQSDEGPRGATQVLKPGGASRREKLSLNSLLAQTHPEGRRVSVMGAAAHRPQGNFENKDETCRGQSGLDALQTLGIGHACKKGLKPESPNQDDFFIYRVDGIGLYGVFDGHGPYGHDISNHVQSNLCQYLWNDDMFDVDKSKALQTAFSKMQTDIQTMCERREFDASLSGCTATVVIHDIENNKLFVAHLGDSRAVMAHKPNSTADLEAVDLTEDHKPTLEHERARIEAHGGEVKKLEGDIPHRVFLKDKLYPGLAMSRAFGDLVATQAGVTSEPEIRELDIDPKEDLFIVLCSDGVWEFISSQEAVQMVASHGRDSVQAAADQLARESWNKWIVEEGDVVDDITVEIVYL